MNIQTDVVRGTADLSTNRTLETKADVTEAAYFPTQIFSLMVPEANRLNAELLGHINAERESDRKGIQRSNFRALGGWHSQNDLHKQDRFGTLVGHIETCAAHVSDANGYHRGYRLEIGTMWSIINRPGSSNRSHIHPSCQWSGVYYVQAPENSGNIEFTDPRTQNLIMQPRFIPNRKRPKPCWTKVSVTPRAGKLLMFPSWLYHAVAPNLSTEAGRAGERVIISFNLTQQKRKASDT